MDHWRLGHLVDQRLGEGLQLLKRSLVSRHQCPRTQGLPKEILTQLRQPIIGQQLLLVQIHHQALKARSILYWRTHPGRKLRPHLSGTMRTTLDLCPMFSHLQGPRRQIEDLAAFIVQHRFPAQSASAALRTNRQLMNANVIGIFDPLQSLPGMPGLAPGFSTTGCAQILGVGFAQTIAGRGFIAVLTVPSQLGFQLFDPLLQLRQSFLQDHDNLDQRFGLAASQRQKFFTREHGTVALGSWPEVDRPKYSSRVLEVGVGDPAGCVLESGPRKSSWRRDNNCPGNATARQTFPAAPPDGCNALANRELPGAPRGPKCGWPTPARAPRVRSKIDCCSPRGPGASGAGG